MRGGRLDRLVTIQRKSVTHSDSGEEVETWTNLAACVFASMEPVRGDERFTGEQRVAEEQIAFQVRYATALSDLMPEDRILFPAPAIGEEDNAPTRSIHDVLAVHEVGRREGIRIITTRRADVR